MAGNFKLDEYVDVAQRIADFYAKYPDGRLVTGSPPQVHEIGGKPFVWYHARAYRTPDDPLPGDGWAAEPVPGPTQFTRDSELMNAETAAWGRAIVACGFGTKKIASRQEVQARQSSAPSTSGAAGGTAPPDDGAALAGGGEPSAAAPAAPEHDPALFPPPTPEETELLALIDEAKKLKPNLDVKEVARWIDSRRDKQSFRHDLLNAAAKYRREIVEAKARAAEVGA